MGCESHLHTSYFTSEVFPTNYVVYRKDRSIGGRGVFVVIKDDLTLSHEPILSASAELVWTKLSIVGIKPLYICSYYKTTQFRPGTSCRAKEFLKPLA